MSPLEQAVVALRRVVEDDPHDPRWRWWLRGALSTVRDALAAPDTRRDEAWLAARGGCSRRRGRQLLARVAALGNGLLDRATTEDAFGRSRRLLVDLEHHVQRLHDLAWDEVELELGGSD